MKSENIKMSREDALKVRKNALESCLRYGTITKSDEYKINEELDNINKELENLKTQRQAEL